MLCARNDLKIDFSFAYMTLLIFISKMNTLTDEILHICAYLSDKDNIHLSATSKHFLIIKFRILFFTEMRVKDIINLSYFHQFTNVIMSDTNQSLPKHVTNLTFCYSFNQTINNCIPDSVTHLTFGHHFNQPINCSLPDSVTYLTSDCWNNQRKKIFISKSVTHLTFGVDFNQEINGRIPDSVTHLTFGYHFNRPINDCIPHSVTHLIFGFKFNQPINSCVPDSVTYLKFGWSFNQSIDSIPISIKYISLSSNYKHPISEKIMPKITRK